MLLREKALSMNPLRIISIGVACFVVSTVLGRFESSHHAVDFLAGMFCGLSITFNIWGLWLYGRQRRGA